MKSIMNKVCLLALSLSCLVSSPLVIAQSNSAAALVPVISLLLEEEQEDPCITPISVGSDVFGRLSNQCPPTSPSDSDAAAYFSFTHTGGPLYIQSLSDSPDSFHSTLNLRQGRGRDGDFVTTPEDGSNLAGNGFGSGRAISSLRYVSEGSTPEGLPAGQYTIEVGFNLSNSGAQRGFTLSVYGDLVTARATGRLNDTGIAVSGQDQTGNSVTCVDPGNDTSVRLQDCHFGRDNDPNLGRDNLAVPNVEFGSDNDGQDGFSFLKVSASGQPLPASSDTPHACVKDNVTGLMWEVKTDNQPADLHNADDTYTWYNTNPNQNGGASGNEGRADTCSGFLDGFASTYCSTQAYVARVNTAGLCGYNDWRMPTVTELQGLLNYNNVANGNGDTLDSEFFPHATNTFFWSASPVASRPSMRTARGVLTSALVVLAAMAVAVSEVFA